MVINCKSCLYTTNHPLGLTINQDGICSGCQIHKEKNTLDWAVRWIKLREIVDQYKSVNSKVYDCILPVTGGQDSYYMTYLVKEKLGLNPLLVSYNKYFNTPLGIRNLSNLRITFDCDLVLQNVNPRSVRNISRTTLREFGSIYWHCLAGQSVFPVQTAVRYGIPLIIWGAHQGVEQVGMFSHEHEVEMTRRYRKEHDLLGREADDLLSIFDTITEDDIWQYRYPDDHDLSMVGVRGIYLSNFVRWDPKAQHELMIKKYKYWSAPFNRTFDTYDHVDCYNYMGLHDFIKYRKHGYSKVVDHACREIRHGRLSRSAAIGIVEFYQSQHPKNVDLYCKWMGIDEQGLEYLINRHSNYPIKNVDSIVPKVSKTLSFIENSEVNLDKKRNYITIGRGYPK